jgi:hypothetical protein
MSGLVLQRWASACAPYIVYGAAIGCAMGIGNKWDEDRWNKECPRGDHMPPAETKSLPTAAIGGALAGALWPLWVPVGIAVILSHKR